MENKEKSKFTDDFLEGSYTYYNYTPLTSRSYLFYPQIVGFQRIGPSYYNEVQYGNVFMINYTSKGGGSFEVAGDKRILRKGDLIFVNSYLHHTLKPLPGQEWEFYFIHIFDNPFVSAIYQRFVTSSGFVISNVNEDEVAPLIEKISNCFKENPNPDERRISGLTYELLMNLSSLGEKNFGERNNFTIRPVVSYIQANYMNHLTLRDVLSQSVYSKNHLERLFKECVGVTISDYISSIRFSKAQELILTSDLSFKEVADQVGLSEYRSLYHMFITKLGVTPHQFKEAGRKVS